MGFSSGNKRPQGLITFKPEYKNEKYWLYIAPTTKEQIHVASYNYDDGCITFHKHGYWYSMTTTKCVKAIWDELFPEKIHDCYRHKHELYCNGVHIKPDTPMKVYNDTEATSKFNGVRFTLNIESEDAAIMDNPYDEICKALEYAIGKLETGDTRGASSILRDTNGNKIGSYNLELPEEEDEDGY